MNISAISNYYAPYVQKIGGLIIVHNITEHVVE